MHWTPGVTVTETHIVSYAGITGDFSAVHVDETFASQTGFGGRIAHGLLGLSITDGLKVQASIFRVGVALSWSWAFKLPIRAGDTVRARLEITAKRVSKSKPDMGIFTISVKLLNQRDETVQEGEHLLMVPRRATPAEQES
ncbi:MaoC/PaaZ C-terminal domain-containing protein [Fulvimarina sp. MAC3]|uniref:MaoC family dehydratase n=1 Tax=Fulvimarina sp. MAC3 TaxID=3148887 RepID=UPI0031FCFD03